MDLGACPNLEDMEGNTPLHVKCYGENGKPSELEAVEMLLNCGAKLGVRNSKVPADMQGFQMNSSGIVCNILQKFNWSKLHTTVFVVNFLPRRSEVIFI